MEPAQHQTSWSLTTNFLTFSWQKSYQLTLKTCRNATQWRVISQKSKLKIQNSLNFLLFSHDHQSIRNVKWSIGITSVYTKTLINFIRIIIITTDDQKIVSVMGLSFFKCSTNALPCILGSEGWIMIGVVYAIWKLVNSESLVESELKI